jgi:16S rRNA (guanine(527)-N(7))-methyltransferase RsmG
MFHVKLSTGLISEATGIEDIDVALLARSERYCTLLLEANRRISLISRGGDEQSEVLRQFLISLAPLRVIPSGVVVDWLDIGSGGGFPAIPLAIFRPRIRFVLAESVAKKAFFLERTVEALDLGNVRVRNQRIGFGRLNGFSHDDRNDWLSIKAVTDWEETLSWGSALLRPGGSLLTYKANAPNTDEMLAIRDNGFELFHTIDLSSFFDDTDLRVFLLKADTGAN